MQHYNDRTKQIGTKNGEMSQDSSADGIVQSVGSKSSCYPILSSVNINPNAAIAINDIQNDLQSPETSGTQLNKGTASTEERSKYSTNELNANICGICFIKPKNCAFVHKNLVHVCSCYQCGIKHWNKRHTCPTCLMVAKKCLKMFLHWIFT